MHVSNSLLEKLETSLHGTSDVFISRSVDAHDYLAGLTANLRANICEPFVARAIVMPPGFPDISIGSTISGMCLAHRDGYWLVYRPEKDRFYCFWGADPSNLGAHGVIGSPLYCWSA